jgi:hypothetical protein
VVVVLKKRRTVCCFEFSNARRQLTEFGVEEGQ